MRYAFSGLLAAMMLGGTAVVAAAELPTPPLIWPLCGRLGEVADVLGWREGDDCPVVRHDLHDLPIHNGYGYRTYVQASRPISFHRGLDLATRAATAGNALPGNPVFAICDGFVYRITGTGLDMTIELKCPEDPARLPMAGSNVCTDANQCITAAYRHVQQPLVEADQVLRKGQHMGYSGQTAPGGRVFEHLHFDILDPRERPTNRNGGITALSKDARNPLRYLPLQDAPDSSDPFQLRLLTAAELPVFPAGGVYPGIEVRARAGFLHNFESAEVQLLRRLESVEGPPSWVRVEKDPARLLIGTAGLLPPGEYSEVLRTFFPVADASWTVSRYVPETMAASLTPHSLGSTAWVTERQFGYFRQLAGGEHPGVDGLIERNAEGLLPAGHRVSNIDTKYIAPLDNPNVSVEVGSEPHTWWGFRWYLREFDTAAFDDYCVAVRIGWLDLRNVASGNGPLQRSRWFLLPASDAATCPAAASIDGIFGDGFESPLVVGAQDLS